MNPLRALILALALAVQPLTVQAQSTPDFAAASAATRGTAEAYFAAYIARDWDKLETLLAEGGGFSDPTATPVFGKVEVTGKLATLKFFRENYAAIKAMHFNKVRTFFSGSHAVFEGTLDWTLVLQGGKEVVTVGMLLVTILRLDSGRVLEHRDFADYQPFVSAHRKAVGGG
jgi:limonene-1,2-epoxide hydrolase